MGVQKFKDFEKALKEEFDAAIICSPTSLHLEQSLKLASLNKHLLIEKPLDSKLDGSEELLKIATQKVNNNDCIYIQISSCNKIY